jgi:cysteine synthase
MSTRKALWQEILNATKNSPIKSVEFEGNTYHFKCDYLLPYGACHYARVFSKLIYLKECLGIIKPGDVLLETTSGSGGRAAAAVATAAGYPIRIAVPAGGERAREQAIVEAGGDLYLTPAEAYINGFPEFVSSFLKANPGAKYLNHMMGDICGGGTNPKSPEGVVVNRVAINAFRPFVEEVIEAGVKPDVVICPIGNGTTTLPMAEDFKSYSRSKKTRVIGFESVASALAYRKRKWGEETGEEKFLRIFGCDVLKIGRHDLPGTTPSATIFSVPALDAAIPLLDGVGLVTSDYVDDLFVKSVGFKPTDKSDWVVKWDDCNQDFLSDFGRTGRAGFAVAWKIARKEKMSGKHFLVPVFDASWHYD